jgi:hypothetical protein
MISGAREVLDFPHLRRIHPEPEASAGTMRVAREMSWIFPLSAGLTACLARRV